MGIQNFFDLLATDSTIMEEKFMTDESFKDKIIVVDGMIFLVAYHKFFPVSL
jgi:hypothetical protein